MFRDVGGSLKKIAIATVILGVIAGIIYLFAIITNSYFWESLKYTKIPLLQFLYVFATIGGSVLMAYFIYGFGILVENSEAHLQYVVERDLAKSETISE